MRYGSVCSGVEAATMAWHHMAWEPSFFSEIEPFPCAVLKHHYPEVPLHGDFTTIGENDYEPIDLLVGGTPCQSFSIAGLRKGMADDRGNLALEFLKLAQRTRPTWVVWENVPGVLSSNGGRDFGAFLGGLGEIGYGFAYRVRDAQYFGVPQRRRRVFVVGYLGNWRPPAAVLFERHSLSGHPTPRREAGEEAAGDTGVGTTGEYQSGSSDMIPMAVDAYNGYVSKESHATVSTQIVHNRNLLCFEPRSPDGVPRISKDVCPTLNTMGGGQREPCVAYALQGAGKTSQNSQESGWNEEVCFTTNCLDVHGVAIKENQQGAVWEADVTSSLATAGGKPGQGYQACRQGTQVRRLTPVECERLQGFPDDFTKIPYRGKPAENCPDGPRYKAMGNSMAVPVMKWIGERIQGVESIAKESA